MGDDSFFKGHGFESQHGKLDGHFSHWFVVIIVEKEAGDGPFKKRNHGALCYKEIKSWISPNGKLMCLRKTTTRKFVILLLSSRLLLQRIMTKHSTQLSNDFGSLILQTNVPVLCGKWHLLRICHLLIQVRASVTRFGDFLRLSGNQLSYKNSPNRS